MKETAQTAKAEKDKEKAKLIQRKEKQSEDAIRAFEVWKQKKDAKIKQTGLYSYHPDPRQAPKGQKWCPARTTSPKRMPADSGKTMQRSFSNKNKLNAVLKLGKGNRGSYSSCSFESDVSENTSRECSPQPDGISGSKIGGVSPHGKAKRKLKTIELCCQTLEYWCECDDSDDEIERKDVEPSNDSNESDDGNGREEVRPSNDE